MRMIKQTMHKQADLYATMGLWAGGLLWCGQFAVFARFTWWEYSWDIMEPITYFYSTGMVMAGGLFYMLFRRENNYDDLRTILHNRYVRKRIVKLNFDEEHYENMKERISDLETNLKLLRKMHH